MRLAAGWRAASSPLDVEFVRNLYEVRAVLEGLAARVGGRAWLRGRAKAEGRALIEEGRAAVESGSVTKQIAADMATELIPG